MKRNALKFMEIVDFTDFHIITHFSWKMAILWKMLWA